MESNKSFNKSGNHLNRQQKRKMRFFVRREIWKNFRSATRQKIVKIFSIIKSGVTYVYVYLKSKTKEIIVVLIIGSGTLGCLPQPVDAINVSTKIYIQAPVLSSQAKLTAKVAKIPFAPTVTQRENKMIM